MHEGWMKYGAGCIACWPDRKSWVWLKIEQVALRARKPRLVSVAGQQEGECSRDVDGLLLPRSVICVLLVYRYDWAL